jgi:hypothetical protein
MTTEEFETVPLASVPARTRMEGSMVLALRALGPGRAIRVAIPTDKRDRARGTWTAAAKRSWGPRTIATRYVDGHLYIWRKGDGND